MNSIKAFVPFGSLLSTFCILKLSSLPNNDLKLPMQSECGLSARPSACQTCDGCRAPLHCRGPFGHKQINYRIEQFF